MTTDVSNAPANDNRLGLHISSVKAAATDAVLKAEESLKAAEELLAAEDTPHTRQLVLEANKMRENACVALASVLAAEQLVIAEVGPQAVY